MCCCLLPWPPPPQFNHSAVRARSMGYDDVLIAIPVLVAGSSWMVEGSWVWVPTLMHVRTERRTDLSCYMLGTTAQSST